MWKKEASFRLGSMAVLLAVGTVVSISGTTPLKKTSTAPIESDLSPDAVLEVDAVEEAENLNSGSNSEPWKLSR